MAIIMRERERNKREHTHIQKKTENSKTEKKNQTQKKFNVQSIDFVCKVMEEKIFFEIMQILPKIIFVRLFLKISFFVIVHRRTFLENFDCHVIEVAILSRFSYLIVSLFSFFFRF